MDAAPNTPAPAQSTVEQGRSEYLDENGFAVEAYEEPWTKASLLGFEFAVPNTENHRRAIKLHDLHHVVTGFGTDVAGEGELSAWELRRGLRGLGVYVSSLVLAGAALGMVVAPRRTLRAWKESGAGQRSLFVDELEYGALLSQTVGELRERLGVPAGGLATARGLHSTAPKPAGA